MKRVLVIGASGYLGGAILARLHDSASIEVMGASRTIANQKTFKYDSLIELEIIVLSYRPDVVVLAIGSPSVDWAEINSVDANTVNVDEPVKIINVLLCALRGIRIVLLSSVYVYSGVENNFFLSVNDTPNPNSIYGLQKRKLEKYLDNLDGNHVIVRLPMVVGDSSNKCDFFNKLLSAKNENSILRMSNHGLRFPVDILWVADAIKHVVNYEVFGIVHLCSKVGLTKYNLSKCFLRLLGLSSDFIVPSEAGESWRRPESLCLETNLEFKSSEVSFCLENIVSRYSITNLP